MHDLELQINSLKNRILTSSSFDEKLALDVFYFQSMHNPVYRQYLELLNISPSHIKTIKEIPFLPISFFKTQQVGIPSNPINKTVFSSSGTTGNTTSSHIVYDVNFYLKITEKCWTQFYNKLSEYCFLCLLPNYLERKGSSLVTMAQYFIEQSKYEESGFYLYDYESLSLTLQQNSAKKIPTVLLGVTFALWDLAEQFPSDLSDVIIMETGGMKGKRPEIIRSDLHHILNKSFQTSSIHSEYGMTELLSQGYSKGNGIFDCPSTLKVLISEINDPFAWQKDNKSGIINIIDLANIESCSFIQTEDLGLIHSSSQFEVLGRVDNSDIRGCNLMISN